ncbi:MAG: sigma factor [Cyanobacteria bacterium P01_E01_bin.6]
MPRKKSEVIYTSIDEWIEYREHPTIERRNAIALQNEGLVSSFVTSTALGVHENQLEEAKTEGYFGLIKAVERFDASTGNRFSSFSKPYIIGAVQQWVRDNPFIKIDRVDYELYSKARSVTKKLTRINGSCSLEEVANACKVGTSRLIKVYETWELHKPCRMPINEDGIEIEFAAPEIEQSISTEERDRQIYEASLAVWRSPFPDAQKQLVINHCLHGFFCADSLSKLRSLSTNNQSAEEYVDEVLQYLREKHADNSARDNSRRIQLQRTGRVSKVLRKATNFRDQNEDEDISTGCHRDRGTTDRSKKSARSRALVALA